MFLRRKSKEIRGVGYSYWNLCETVRTARGPRQRVVASLGKLDEAQVAGLKDGWEDLPALLRGESTSARPATGHLPGLEPPVPPPPAQWEQADVRGLPMFKRRASHGFQAVPAIQTAAGRGPACSRCSMTRR